MEVFTALAEKAQQNDQSINFGNITSPEFKARLLIACITKEPPVKMQNAPEVSAKFLEQISTQSKNSLRIVKAKLAKETPKENKPSPTSPPSRITLPKERN